MVKLGVGLLLLVLEIDELFNGDTGRALLIMIFIYAFAVSAVMMTMMRFCGAFFGEFFRFLRSRKRAGELVSGEEESSDGERKRCWIGGGGSVAKRCRVGGESGERNRERLLGMAQRNASSDEIDEDLHSRQLAVYGRDTMLRLSASDVLVSGMQGLGAEIAKNLVLAGVRSVTLHDEGKLELWDLSGNFLVDESDTGQNRALASSRKLQELNAAVAVQTLTTQLTKQKLSNFQAVVFTDISLGKAIEFNDYCRSHEPPIAFIKTEVRGLFGSLFCDFGPEFTVFDVDGEAPHTGIVSSISNEDPALVSCVDERLGFQDGDFVVFSEVRGMVELNDGKPRKIKSAGRYSFTLEEDTRKFRAHEGGGIVTQVKQPKVLKFKPLVEALHDPGEFLLSDFSKFDRPPLLHLAFQALDKFASDSGRLPVAGSEEDARKLILIARGINGSSGDKGLKDVDEKILRHFALGAKAVLNPMAAVFGGIAAQEVLKACSGKFHPLFQFFYFDSLESLPVMEPHPMVYRPMNDRYDAQLSVLGSRLKRRMEAATTFIVGSGALGCELLKNIALMGVSCGEKGKSIVTDDDVIEKSNLSRQFLFRDSNIGQFKSTVAASAAAKINHRLNVKAMQNRVCAETEHVFVDDFWEDVSVVLNALDNVEARLYVDQKCLYFQKPLLESGTLGAKCNTQVVIPYLTENYGATRDPPEKEAPLCTLRSFPYNIDHCLAWARSEFEDWLETTPREVNAYLSRPDEYVSRARSEADQQSKERLERVLKCIGGERCKTVEDCIAWARFVFEDNFANQVKQLTDTFPVDAVVSNGSPFWSAPKRFPRPVEFSASDPSHVRLVMAASILRAETFGISIPDWVRNPSMLAEFVDKLTVPAFKAKQGHIKIDTEDQTTNDDKMATDEDLQTINALISKIERYRASLPPGFKMRPIHFEKDDDDNHHVDLIAGLANMRARNYGIPEVDKLTAKLIAGRIIPAIATSTAVAAGLVCLELYKVLDGRHGVEDYRNAFANLALPLFSMAEPVRARATEHGGQRWSAWDRWVYVGDPTLGELLTWLKTAKGLDDVYSISCGSSIIYNGVAPRHRERWGTKLRDLIHGLGLELPAHRRRFDLVVGCVDEDDRDVEVPLISVYFR